MPIITFISDVPNAEQPQAGPLYREGYSCDVAEAFAQSMIAKGVAAMGVVVSLPEEAPAPVVQESYPAEAEPAPEPHKGKRRFR